MTQNRRPANKSRDDEQGLIFGDNPQPFLDLRLFQMAEKRGKKTGFLEDGNCHIALSGCHWPVSEQIKYLKSLVKNFDRTLTITSRVKELYEKRKVFSIYREFMKNLESATNNDEDGQIAQVLFQKMVMERNPAIATKTLDYLKEGNALICVGSSHLFGKNGVLNLIYDQGYKISCDDKLRNSECMTNNNNNTECLSPYFYSEMHP